MTCLELQLPTTIQENTNRAANISHGASLINNALIYPGEEFSSLGFLGPLTKENGYYTAGAYMSGTVVDSYGGGFCQLSKTFYHALL